MRITKVKNSQFPGMVNIAEEAHKLWKDLQGSRYAISRAQAYREKLDEYFSSRTSLGGYPTIAILGDSSVLCPDCARNVYLCDGSDVSLDVYWEGEPLYCEDCNKEIDSAYGDPEDHENYDDEDEEEAKQNDEWERKWEEYKAEYEEYMRSKNNA